jgi:hypothetical protein
MFLTVDLDLQIYTESLAEGYKAGMWRWTPIR